MIKFHQYTYAEGELVSKKPTDLNYRNAGREREALIEEIGQEAYNEQRKEAREERKEKRKVKANRADRRRQRPTGLLQRLQTPPQHPLSMKTTQERIAAEVAELVTS